MRTGLRLLVGKRVQVVCRVGRIEQGFAGQNPRLLVHNVFDQRTGEFYADHMWLRYEDMLRAAGPTEGDTISFKATVDYYIRTTLDGDYGLRHFSYVVQYAQVEQYEQWVRRIHNKKHRERIPVKQAEKVRKARGRTGQRLVDFGVYCEDGE